MRQAAKQYKIATGDPMGKIVIVAGLLIVVMGLMIILLERFGLPHLPGDILIRRDSYTVYIPVTTAIVISIVLSLLFYLGSRLFR